MSFQKRAEGSFGSRHGQPWTEHGARARRRAEDSSDSTKAGTSDPESLLTVERVREFLDAYLCPWCGAGPFKVVAAHTNKAHGVNKRELRERAGLSLSTKITPAEFSEQLSESSRDHLAAISVKGRAAVAEKYGDGIQRLATEGHIAANARKRDEARRRVLELFEKGLPLSKIQDEAGIGVGRLRAILDEEALRESDLRGRGAAIRGDANLGAATVAFQKASQDRRLAFVARYDALGHTEEGLNSLAAEYSASRKSVMARLRKYGCDVPDLRGKSRDAKEAHEKRRGRPKCSVDGCDRPNAARSLCDKHYRRWKKIETSKPLRNN